MTSQKLVREMGRLYPPTPREELQMRVREGTAPRCQSPSMAARPWEQPHWSDFGAALGFLACLVPAVVVLWLFG